MGRVSASVSHDHQVIKNMIFLTCQKLQKKKHSNKSKIQKLSISKIKKIQQWQISQKGLLAN